MVKASNERGGESRKKCRAERAVARPVERAFRRVGVQTASSEERVIGAEAGGWLSKKRICER